MGGSTWYFVLGLAGLVGLIAWVDFKTMRIPDALTTGVILLGLTFVIIGKPEMLHTQILFSLMIFASFWAFQIVHQKYSGRLGLGFGDVKLFGAASVWIMPLQFPLFLFTSAASALAFVFLVTRGSIQSAGEKRIPFGPFIGAGLVFTFIYQEQFL